MTFTEVKLITAGVITLAVAVTIGLLDDRLHHYKKLYNQDEKQIAVLNHQIGEMTSAQNTQRMTTEGNVIKVIQGPDQVQTVTKEIRNAPVKPDCRTPVLSQEALNAF